MTTLFPAEKTCPVCQTVFSVTSVGSCGFSGKTRDFMPKYWGLNPLPYFVNTCPRCGYSAAATDFQKPLEPEMLHRILSQPDKMDTTPDASQPEKASLKDGAGLRGAWEKYWKAAEYYELKGASAATIAHFYHQAAWTARVVDLDPTQEQKCMEQAIGYFKNALGQLPLEQRAVIRYLLGELHRRLKRPQEAIQWFNQVEEKISDLENQEWLLTWTNEQRQLCKSENTEMWRSKTDSTPPRLK